MGHMSPDSLATELARMVRAAGLSVAPYLRSVARTVTSFDTKRDFHDPVTAHDRAVEARLRRVLGALVPGSRVLGEETGEHVLPGGQAREDEASADLSALLREDGDARRLGARLRWIVDPIDGTANFAAGLPYFNTSIAAELDGRVVAGAISVPLTHELFAADLERAWHEGPEGVRDLHADGPSRERDGVLLAYYPGRRALHHDARAAVNQERRLADAYSATRRFGACALDLAHVAAGWAGAMIGTNFRPWDVAAGIHLVCVAGGRVLNLPLSTSLPDGLRPGVVAEGAHLDAATPRAVLREVQARFDARARAAG